jgi:hypothetical protein
MRPLDGDHITLEVQVRYQACTEEQCLMPRTEKLSLDVPLEVIDVPKITLPEHIGHGQRESNYNGMPHLRRFIWRSIKRNPLGFLRFLKNNLVLELAARRRLQASKRQ